MDSFVPNFDLLSLGGVNGNSNSSERRSIWNKVLKTISENEYSSRKATEIESLNRLCEGWRWLEMVEPEWRNIYGAIYDEASSFEKSVTDTAKIEKDIHRTFGLFIRNIPNLRLSKTMSEYHKSLSNILNAAIHECGYCQGINFLAALFLLYEKDERDSFILLCFLLKNRHLEILFNSKCSSLFEYMNSFAKRFRRHNKRVYQHLRNIGFTPVCYAVEWFTTCFIVTCPGDFSACVIDLLLCGYDDIMIRVGLTIMDYLQDDLLSIGIEELQLNFKNMVSTSQLSLLHIGAYHIVL